MKRFVAQRHTTLLLVVATGREFAAMACPTATKADVAIRIAGTLGLIATNHADRVGLLLSRGGTTVATRPSGKVVELERLLGEVERASGRAAARANLPGLLEKAAAVTRTRCLLAIISDDIAIDSELEPLLRRLASQHDVYFFAIPDADPTRLDGTVRGLDDDRRLPAELRGDARLRDEIAAAGALRSERRGAVLRRLGIVHREFADPDTVVGEVIDLMRWRGRAR